MERLVCRDGYGWNSWDEMVLVIKEFEKVCVFGYIFTFLGGTVGIFGLKKLNEASYMLFLVIVPRA